MLDSIRALREYQILLEAVRRKIHLPGLALPRAARLPVTALLSADLALPVVLITDRADHALTQLDELGFWAKDALRLLFPEPTPLFYEQASWGNATRRDRLQALSALAVYHIPGANRQPTPPLIVTPARAIMARTLPRRDFIKACRTLKVGQTVAPDALLRTWVDIGYQPADIVLEPGQFSRRGGILDIWVPAESLPARLDFFGDEIDTLRLFDPASQRTVQALQQLFVTPAREVLPGKISAELTLAGEDMNEFSLPLVHRVPASLLDYLPSQAVVLLDDLDTIQVSANEIEEQAVRLRRDSIREGTLPADFPIPYLSWSELQDNLGAHNWLELGRGTAEGVSEFAALFTPGPRFGGRLKPVVDYLAEQCGASGRVMVVSRQISRLKELWDERRHNAEACGTGAPEFIEGTLTEGWILQPAGGAAPLHLLTDSEVFGWERPQPRQRHRPAAVAPEAGYADFKPGDWVVHIDYGIGRYVGLVQRHLDGAAREFLQIEYEGGDQLYVPVYQADRLGRYIGPDGEPPNPTRLGTQEWNNDKQRVKTAVEEVARELLELSAQRQLAQGHAFKMDTPWQQELEASFPYIETNDQLKAIAAVKKDMESPRPMDRLLTGDVGYGKTEVALRAAFKAVMDGKQVGLLVPTTVLAQQHYETFRQRLAAFPVTVEMLSRFRSAREQGKIIQSLVLGGVDIVIGTHRLLQPDVQFKDLGLVIIDEEQRFGVTHKEYLKRLRTEVDVLTLTATPIPRTLYMALTGVRDISTINSPPEERLPIVTHIGPYSANLVRQAILRELERGGQVFFVHNRVQTIGAMERHLHNLIPEARVGVGHGQMPEHELSRVMEQFNHAQIDVLLCTSIIESGLDIPNANTLIVDRADTFGLAQLYQLRGRVGRGAQRAYAYFFRHRKKPPTVEGQERMEVIAENTQLGAGYSIAMRDLEMRGAGELLGTRQHGYIATVGFHLYTRLLAQAVRQLRQMIGLPEENGRKFEFKLGHMPVNVELPLAVGIPIEYISDQNMRLQLYRRLADMQNEDDLRGLAEELKDRFGTPPEAVTNLMYQMQVKMRAEQAGLVSVTAEGEQVVMRYPPLPEGMNQRNLPNIGMGTRTGKNAYWMALQNGAVGWRDHLLDVLSAIIEL